jgi:SAM-dependent methyltransferase
MPTPKEGVWVDLGGGTGANLEHLGERLHTFSKVFILDLTPSLLAVAKERVAARGWGKLVSCVEGDATVKGVAGLPKAGTVDLVTCSYSLTMIPDWKAAIENVRCGCGCVCVCVCGMAWDIFFFMRGVRVHPHNPTLFLTLSHPTTLYPPLTPPRRPTTCSSLVGT